MQCLLLLECHVPVHHITQSTWRQFITGPRTATSCVPSHPIAPHQIPWHHFTSDHMAASDITSHDMSQLTTLTHHTSPHNQLHYFISPRNRPHDIITHHITTTAHHHHGTAEGWFTQKTRFWASHWFVALRTFYREILSLVYSFFPPETSAPGSPGNYL